MQNVVNYIVPFFGNDGKPISAGRVFFCNKNTSARKSSDIQPPDLILIKDKDGKPIQNPLPLDDSGRFTTQPFVDYDVDFKMYVDEPTGLPTELDDDSPCWNTVLVMNSFDNKFVKVEYSGIPVVENLAQLRMDVPVETPAVMVLGYYTADDFCPPRVFRFQKTLYSENYGTHIVPASGGGAWVCEPGDVLDLRWFGVNPNAGAKTDYTARIIQAAQSYPSKAVLFTSGNYYLSSSVSINSVILERNAFIRPFGSSAVYFGIVNLENRGGKFCEGDSGSLKSARVIPVVTGVFRTSWLSGNLCAFCMASPGGRSTIWNNCDVVIFDGYADDDSEVDYELLEIASFSYQKVFIVEKGSLPRWVSIKRGRSVVVDGVDGSVSSNGISVGKLTFVTEYETVDDRELAVGTNVYYENTLICKFSLNDRADFKVLKVDALSADSAIVQKLYPNVENLEKSTAYIRADRNVDLYNLMDYDVGDVVRVENVSSQQRQIGLWKDPSNISSPKRYFTLLNTSCVLSFICTAKEKYDPTIPYSEDMTTWKPMYNANITTADI